MFNSKITVFMSGLFIGVLLGGGAGWWAFSQSAAPEQTSQTSQEASNAPKQAKNVETMTLAEMTEELEKAPEDDFERQYLRYAIHLGNYTTAINRIAKERAEREELQSFATSYHDASSELTRQLFEWQETWGYTDH